MDAALQHKLAGRIRRTKEELNEMAAAVQARPNLSPVAVLASWARQTIEFLVAAQRILLDLTAQQNALVIGLIRERLSMPGFHPVDSAVEMAGQGITSFIEVQKILLELATNINAIVVNAIK